MKLTNKPKAKAEEALQDARISFRLHAPLAQRVERVKTASKRTRTSIIDECLERALPKLEKQVSVAA
jgi:predicted DNA-binding protein